MKSSTNGKVRGFAAMEPERRRDISRKGGIAAHTKGTAHQWDATTAREAGRKGGLAHRARREAAMAANQSAGDAGPEAASTDDKLSA